MDDLHRIRVALENIADRHDGVLSADEIEALHDAKRMLADSSPMTHPTDTAKSEELKAGGPIERWPGYNEQSWPERFAELDRRYAALQDNVAAHLMRTATNAGLEHRYFPEPASVAGKVEITQADRDAARHFARTMHQTGGRPVSGFNLIAGKMNPEDSIPMILHCPTCGTRHIDEQDFAEVPHHTHACQGCGLVWRPAKVNTHGVRFLPGYKNQDQTNEVTHG